ncbi:prenyltransferase [Flavobacterium salilacus subsp. salilacus]|uniref:UbiA family prenyltransferase n=1 Tax=Flavobacterium TaxID=237 RepID=UPI0010754D6E|nr:MULTISPECIES: UbiA family prenyltransferase [Flavobacterium]KAF2518589.1 prenyltransferase [Flavobacterium salilacus subsp. salilacus]MBE1613545.1 prenyltransferase [Flavobacterium sp. SaA2.13]
MEFLKRISFNNLLLLAFGLLVFRYGFLDLQPGLPLALNHWQYALMVLATLLVAAGGFLVYNYHARDEQTSEGKTYNIYAILTLAGIGIGYYLSDYIGKPLVVTILIIAAAIIYLYATSLKQMLIVSNFIVATAVAMSIIVIGVYNLYPLIMPGNKTYLATIFEVMLDYTLFIFIITFILTLVYNLRDTDRDYNSGNTTLPIVIGKDRAVKVVFFAAFIPLAFLFYYVNKYLLNLTLALGYGLLFVITPMIYFLVKLWTAKTTKDFNHLVFILKMVLFFTILSIAVITYNIQNNA